MPCEREPSTSRHYNPEAIAPCARVPGTSGPHALPALVVRLPECLHSAIPLQATFPHNRPETQGSRFGLDQNPNHDENHRTPICQP